MHDAAVLRDEFPPFPGEADELSAAVQKLAQLNEMAAALKEEIDSLLRVQALNLNLDLGGGIDLPEELKKIEVHFIRSALRLTAGHQTRAARLLGIKLTTLNQKLKKLGIDARGV